MEFKQFVRKPFTIEAVEITVDNIAECAIHIGELQEQNGSPYILVDSNLIPNVLRVFPGYWMTRMNDNFRCYSKKVFREQFVEQDPTIKQLVNYVNGERVVVTIPTTSQ
jgi:hypothetical protein